VWGVMSTPHPEEVAAFPYPYRVLKPGDRLAIPDVLAFADIPAELRDHAGRTSRS
jgi:hypothetical protein